MVIPSSFLSKMTSAPCAVIGAAVDLVFLVQAGLAHPPLSVGLLHRSKEKELAFPP